MGHAAPTRSPDGREPHRPWWAHVLRWAGLVVYAVWPVIPFVLLPYLVALWLGR